VVWDLWPVEVTQPVMGTRFGGLVYILIELVMGLIRALRILILSWIGRSELVSIFAHYESSFSFDRVSIFAAWV
jgi:hypothetical protein